MKRNKLTEQDKKTIWDLYKSGKSYREITKDVGFSSSTLTKIVGGYRTLSQCALLARKNGNYKLSNAGRLKLSENGRKACIRSGKFWTKPERFFRDIILEIGIGVKYPDYIKEIKKVEDDKLEKLFCYQYPIQRYILDYVDVENKVAININGDYWHANPLLYEPNKLSKPQIVNVRQDKNKKIFLEKHGWKVVNIWESEIYWNKQLVKEKIRTVSLTAKRSVYTAQLGFRLPHCPPDWSETIKKLWFRKTKIKKVVKNRTSKIKKICFNYKCGKEFEVCHYNIKRKYCCPDCYNISNRKIARPAKEVLEELIKNKSMTAIGKQYGVSARSVKKWAIKYNIDFKNIMMFPKNFIKL